MIKFLLLFPMILFAISTQDLSSVGFDQLSETEKADIVKLIAERSDSTSSQKSVVSPENIDKWAEIGMKIGKAIGLCAKELNVAVNDFLKTPAGKFTFMMIAWKIMASDIIHVGGFLLLMLTGILLTRALYKNWTITNVEFDKEKVDIFRRPTKTYEKMTLSGESVGGLFAILAAFITAAAICLYTM